MIKACVPYYCGNLHKACIRSCEKAAKAGLLYWNEKECLLFGPEIARQRNLLIDKTCNVRPAIDKRFDGFLCMGSDVVFEPYHIEMLYECKKDIVSGLYRKGHKIVGGNLMNDCMVWLLDAKGIELVDWIGMEFTYISRKYFETVPAPWFENFTIVKGGKYLQYGEDVSFCIRAGNYGFQKYIHADCVVKQIPKKIKKV